MTLTSGTVAVGGLVRADVLSGASALKGAAARRALVISGAWLGARINGAHRVPLAYADVALEAHARATLECLQGLAAARAHSHRNHQGHQNRPHERNGTAELGHPPDGQVFSG